MNIAILKTCALCLFSLSACAQTADMQAGKRLFDENCALCHGTNGRGVGPLTGMIPGVPIDLTQLSRNNGGKFPMLKAMSTIDGFRHEADRYRPGMPEFGPLMNVPMVLFDSGDGIPTATPKPLVEIALYLESLQE